MPKEGANGSTEPAGGVPLPVAMPRPGETFAGRYRIERMVGRGGMGEVYVAVQAPLNRRVALKVLKPPANEADDPNFDQRFLREAEAAASLQHPNTITVFDFGQTDDGQLYIVMEYLEGRDLRAAIAHEGVFPARRAIHVAKQVCKSLREAHGQGMVHRDLKPANVVLLDRDDDPDFVKVLDFGLVKFKGEEELTLAGKFLGSPRYTAPEALDRNATVDQRADIYAVGILLYAMLTGQPPFAGDPMQVLNAHLHETPKPMHQANPAANTTPAVERLVARCLAKKPDDRFASMVELLRALREVGQQLGDEETETLDIDGASLSDMLAPEPDSTSSLRVDREQVELAAPVDLAAPRAVLKPLAVAGVVLLLAVLAALAMREPTVPAPAMVAPVVAPSVAIEVSDDVEVRLVVRGGEAVEVRSGEAWVAVGEGDVDRVVPLPDGDDVVRLRVRRGGDWAEHAVPLIDGTATLAIEAEATPEPAVEPTPEPVAKPSAKPAAKPSAKPSAKPAAKPSAKPVAKPAPTKPAPPPEPVAEPAATPAAATPEPTANPSGYKDNPY